MKRIVTMMALAAAMMASVAVAQCPATCSKEKKAACKCESCGCTAQVKKADCKCDKCACAKKAQCPKAKECAAKKSCCPNS